MNKIFIRKTGNRVKKLLLLVILLISCTKYTEPIDQSVESRALECNSPIGLVVSDITATSAKFTWRKESTAKKYRVEWAGIATIGNYIYHDVTDTTFTIPGLYSGATYQVRVKSLCEGWDNGTFLGASSAPSQAITFTTLNTTKKCYDNYEDNNNFALAKTIPSSSTLNAKISPPIVITDRKGSLTFNDVDWFRFTKPRSHSLIKVDLTNLPANYGLRLYYGSASKVIPLASSNKGLDSTEQIQVVYTGRSYLYVEVYGVNSFNDFNCYQLKVSTQ